MCSSDLYLDELTDLARKGRVVYQLVAPEALEKLCAGERHQGVACRLNYAKPVELEELLLKIGAIMRRANINAGKELTVGRLKMNADEQSCVYDGEEIPLTVREFNLLYKLLSYPKKTFTRSQLMNEFWDIEATSGLRSVDVYMRKLREKFEHCDDFEIVTVHGLGYKAVIK